MKVLVCPLNWGLGHAARLVPIIKLLYVYNFEVIIACSGDSLSFLKKEFENSEFIDFPNYKMKYSHSESQVVKMLFKLPAILYSSIKEHYHLKRVIKKSNINIVISDNRFGLWNRKVYSIFITHQLRVIFPGILYILEPVYYRLIRLVIRKYDECWIPDFKGKFNLSGKLSHFGLQLRNTYFIGALSRFELPLNVNNIKKHDVLFILSGPEPQRSILEKLIYEQTKETGLSCAIVRGTELTLENVFSFPVFNIVNTNDLFKLINESELIICRSGYSSVMDLVTLNKKAVLIPTPGQTEQEYLADYLNEKKLFYTVKQSKFNLIEAIANAFDPQGIINTKNNTLNKKIKYLIEIQNNQG